ncbi:unnamed protein product (macronuclear) [Paramecium tetraurelia]|uniref:Chromosome undetermined scaffold_1, whole genome shotgun sequence n=1 Tax=Paramecium tetraurelia TaxID=5888 RepID=Q6BG16_PARTE|nr:hypothetical protein [Paramecium tetraurelia strain d4-2]XP_001423276.1 uncharacterized protein GSPATT00000313001 [Paramecium tetraurelia]CAH03404.1 hypothetical transmembrane protein [Paramecium tetraurelia]CAK55878.1 unnamed protein product [Paramecium tetraurelia]|eukprot:XP_001423276.1 hypothetical protein (macronuclear) [Paramecium tetraurelia strain d4-2]
MITINIENNEDKVLIQEQPSATPQQNENQQEKEIQFQKVLEIVRKSDSNYFKYPPDLDLAQLHKQAYYLCPNQEIINKYQFNTCPCCNKTINKNKFNWITSDFYEQMTDEYGIAVPLYFTLIKFQVIIFIIVFCIYGIIFMKTVHQLCDPSKVQLQEQCDDYFSDYCKMCEFRDNYHFIDIVSLQKYFSNEADNNEKNYFEFAAFFVFFINLHLPFLYDLLVSYIEIKYWSREPCRRQTETKHSIYVRHLQNKMQPNEIFDLIKRCVEKHPNQDIASQSDKLVDPLFKEIIYIYDVEQLIKFASIREAVLIEIIQNIQNYSKYCLQKDFAQQINCQTKLENNLTLLEDINNKIQKETGNVQLNQLTADSLKDIDSLQFSKKAIIHFADKQVFSLVHSNFKRTFFQDLKIKLKFIVHPKLSDKIAVKKSYRINGLFWNHLGAKSMDRVIQKCKSIVIMIFACAILMVAYELIYLYVNDPDFQTNKASGKLTTGEKAATNIFTILVPIITTSAILAVIINQKKAQKSTFAHQERGFMHFLIVVNYLLVTFVPYLFTFELWNGKEKPAAIYNLISLTQNKLITKHIFHLFHIRFISSLLRTRKALKNYLQYFQGQLNQLITPPFFPQRSRNCNALYSITIGLCLIYVCPLITLICFFFNLFMYFFDRYTTTHIYAIDKRFTIILMRHQIKVYSIAFYPIKIYLFVKLFWDYEWLIYAGLPLCVSISLLNIIFRKQIINFILLTILKMEKSDSNQNKQETYSENYLNYLKSIYCYYCLKIQKQTKPTKLLGKY